MSMTEKEKWYAMKTYSMFTANQRDIFDYLFFYEGFFTGSLSDLTRSINCAYVTVDVVEKELTQTNLFSSLFCITWQEEDDEGKRLNNSDLKLIFMLDTVWERLVQIGQEILGEIG